MITMNNVRPLKYPNNEFSISAPKTTWPTAAFGADITQIVYKDSAA